MENPVKDPKQYSKHYSESNLWSKLSQNAGNAGKKLVFDVLLLYYVLKDPDTPITHKTLIIGTLGYFILPIDIIPDVIPVAGYGDDAAAVAFCIKIVRDNITPRIRSKAQAKIDTWF